MPNIIHDPYYPTVLSLRKKLEKLLTPYLGKYGTDTLAIWVEPPSTPKQAVSGGLECTIRRHKNVISTELLLNAQANDTLEWLVQIKTNERTQEIYTKFDAAIEAIRLNFPFRRETIGTFGESETLIATFRIPENIIFNTNLINTNTTSDSVSLINPPPVIQPPPPTPIPPTINLIAPTTGIINQSVTLTANVATSTDSISKVEFYINNVLTSTKTSTPYNFVWTPTTVNTFIIKAVVTNSQNLSTTSNLITFVATSDTTTTEPPLNDSATPNPVAQNLIGINITPCLDYANPAFRDAIKQARKFESIDGTGNSVLTDANGFPKEDAAIFCWDRPFDMHGVYAGSYQGQNTLPAGGGNLDVFGATISNKTYNAATNTVTFNLTVTGSGNSQCKLTFTNTNGGIKNLKLLRPTYPGSSTSYDSSKLFTDQFVAAINKFYGVRTLDWTGVNSSPMANVSDRTLPTDWSQQQSGSGYLNFAGKGCCWEYTIALMNECYEAAPNTFKRWWYNMPVLATDAFVTAFFNTVKNGAPGYAPLNPNIQLVVEFGNENWNFNAGFEHSGYNAQKADQEISNGDTQLAWNGASGVGAGWQRQARRTVQISRIARQVFGDSAMGTRIFIALQWQINNGQNTAGTMLKFLEDKFYVDEGLGKTVSDDIQILGASAYYSPNNDDPLLTLDSNSPHAIWTSQSMVPEVWKQNTILADAHYVAAFSPPTGILPYCSYEGGTSFDASYDGSLTDSQKASIAAVKTAANQDNRITGIIQSHHDIRSSIGGDWLFYLSLGGNGVDDYSWAFTPDIKNLTTPKLQAIANLQSSTRAPLVLEPHISSTSPTLLINGTSYNLNNVGYNKESFDQGEMRSYTFRVHETGNYKFSVSSNNAGTLNLYLGTLVIGNSITTPGNNEFSTPITRTLNPGLYAFRYRLLSNDTLYMGQVKIEKV